MFNILESFLIMKKYIVETYYTCTFKTTHTLNDLNESELSKIDQRNDGNVEVIDVKLNNRKTKKIGEEKNKSEENIKIKSSPSNNISKTILKKDQANKNEVFKSKNKVYRFNGGLIQRSGLFELSIKNLFAKIDASLVYGTDSGELLDKTDSFMLKINHTFDI